MSNLEAKVIFDLDEDNQFSFEYQNKNKLANNNYNLYQSSFVNYNWSNNFKNEKINSILANATTKWVNFSAQYTILKDFLFFEDITTAAQKLDRQQIVAPNQYDKTINYLSVKASREFNFGKFGFDNTFLYQKLLNLMQF